jgi:hypothetical protein
VLRGGGSAWTADEDDGDGDETAGGHAYTWVAEQDAPKPFHRLLDGRAREFYRITP